MEKNSTHTTDTFNNWLIMLSESHKAERLHTVGFYLYKILEAVKVKSQKVNQWISGAGWEEGGGWKGHVGLFGDVLYVDCSNDYATGYIYQAHLYSLTP